MTCKKHANADASSLCALCLLSERNELRAEINMLQQRVTDEGVIRGLQDGEQLVWVSISDSQEIVAGQRGVDKIVVSFENGSQAAMPWAAVIGVDGGCIGKYNLANCLAFMPKNQALEQSEMEEVLDATVELMENDRAIKTEPDRVEGFVIGDGT